MEGRGGWHLWGRNATPWDQDQPLGQYWIILLSNRDTYVWISRTKLLRNGVWPGVEETTSRAGRDLLIRRCSINSSSSFKQWWLWYFHVITSLLELSDRLDSAPAPMGGEWGAKGPAPPPARRLARHNKCFTMEEIIKIVATRCQILRLKCTKSFVGWSLQRSPRLPIWILEAYF